MIVRLLPRIWVAHRLLPAYFLLASCGYNQAPSFTEDVVDYKPVALTIENADIPLEAKAVSDEDMESIFETLATSEKGGSEGHSVGTMDATVAGGQEFGSEEFGSDGRSDTAGPDNKNQTATEETSDFEQPSDSEVDACARLHGVGSQYVKAVKSQKMKSLSNNSVLALKVTGNKTIVDLDLNSRTEVALQGVCLFTAGNQSGVIMRTNITVRRLVYIARGNKSFADIQVTEPGKIESMQADLAGNDTSLQISGDGIFPCETVRTRNASAHFECR